MTGLIIFYVALIVLMVAAMWKVFEKAGHPGWAAIVPIYNMYILTQMAGKPGYWVVLMLIPFLNYVFIIWTWNLVVKNFGKSEGFTVGIIFLGIIFIPMLAWGDAEWQGETATPSRDDVLDS